MLLGVKKPEKYSYLNGIRTHEWLHNTSAVLLPTELSSCTLKPVHVLAFFFPSCSNLSPWKIISNNILSNPCKHL